MDPLTHVLRCHIWIFLNNGAVIWIIIIRSTFLNCLAASTQPQWLNNMHRQTPPCLSIPSTIALLAMVHSSLDIYC